MVKKTNELILCRDDYSTQEEFENEIKKAVMLLLNSRKIMTIRYDEPGIGVVAIEYETDDISIGTYYPYWLLPQEKECVIYADEE
jgi:hypothetical protein